jgi:hypothetical protein
MTTGTIELAEQELALLEQIDFNWHSHDSGRRSCDAAARLMPLLLQRKAIPEHRLRYFDDPELNGGRKSRLQVFEGNGTVGVDIFGHGNFLRHLRYFIHGAALPERIKSQMAELVGDPSYFTSGDLEPARKLARQLARSSGLGSASSDSFFQLMNDLGLSPSCADSVRRAVLSVR